MEVTVLEYHEASDGLRSYIEIIEISRLLMKEAGNLTPEQALEFGFRQALCIAWAAPEFLANMALANFENEDTEAIRRAVYHQIESIEHAKLKMEDRLGQKTAE